MYLNCHSYYSLRYGTLSIEELVASAKSLGIDAMVLADINTSMGIMDFIKECNENDIQPIAGIEFYSENVRWIGIARNNAGFSELNEYLTAINLDEISLSPKAPGFNNVFVVYPFGTKKSFELKDNEYIGIKPREVPRLVNSEILHAQSKLVILHPVTLSDDFSYYVHRNLRAIDNNALLDNLKPDSLAGGYERFVTIDKLLKSYALFPDIAGNTEKLLSECRIGFDFKTIKNKKTFTGSRYDDKLLLEKLALDGFKYRYKPGNEPAKKRLRHELEIIDSLGFSSYFLITWDIIRYSLSQGIYHVGRGSGANSIVAYCLRITDVDPIELDLYFERFINNKRTSPPDFDIDYSWKDRDQVQDYIFKRYGHKHTALLGATVTFRDKAILRELGKVHGLPREEIDALVSMPEDRVGEDSIKKTLFEVGRRIMDFPNIRSIHAGGILISEEPLTNYTALDLPPKGFPTTQWDMYVAEMIGFEKLDILSQRGIGHIQECAEIVLGNKKEKIDVHDVSRFKTDGKVNDRLFNGEAIGCFYIESPAMRGLLKKLRCNDYLRLVAASSIIRPGVAKSGMMREYIKRFHNPDSFKYLHPIFEEQLKETFGVMVYQEDVIKICHHFAGLDLSDADILRRAMSGKYRSKKEFERIRDTFFNNCDKKGYSHELTSEVWRQISSFAGYAFSKAHSASYAVESYQSLFLKTYFPHEFMVAVINNFGGFYSTWVYVNEAKQLGATIHLPCLNKSQYKTSIAGEDIYLGFVHVKGLEKSLCDSIIRERNLHGNYRSLADFIKRVHIGIEQLKILIRVGAFQFTGKSKKKLLWESHLLINATPDINKTPEIFETPEPEFVLPDLHDEKIEDAYDEIEFLGFPVSVSRFDMLKTNYRGDCTAGDLSGIIGKKTRILGDLVIVKNVHTVKKEWMHFGCFLDYKGKFFDTVNFPPSLKKYPFTGFGIYLIEGKVVEEFGFPSIEVEKMARLPYLPDPRYVNKIKAANYSKNDLVKKDNELK